MVSLGMRMSLQQIMPLQNTINPLLGVSPLELELLLDESRADVEKFYEREPGHLATGNYFHHSSFRGNATGVKGKISPEEHLKNPQIIIKEKESTEEGKYAVMYNPELEARIREKLKQFHRREGKDAPPPEQLFSKKFAEQWGWIKEQQQKIVGYLLQRQEKYLVSGNVFDLEPINQPEIAEHIGYTDSTAGKLMRNLTVQLSDGRTIFASDLAPSHHTSVIQGMYALTELMKDETYFARGEWQISDEKLRPVLEERFGLRLARRTVAKYRGLLDKNSEVGKENA